MLVSFDGGKTYQDAPSGVEVMYTDLWIPGEDERGELYVRLASEGVIIDVWSGEKNLGTSSESLEDVVGRLVDDNA
jgi:hypothetical protein